MSFTLTVLPIAAALAITIPALIMSRPPKKAIAQKGRGFTLIELMIILAIIGIIASIAVPAYLNMNGSGNKERAENDMRTYVAQLYPGAPANSPVTCATSTSSRYARCTANVMVSDGKYQLVEAECGVGYGTQGCGPVRGARGYNN